MRAKKSQKRNRSAAKKKRPKVASARAGKDAQTKPTETGFYARSQGELAALFGLSRPTVQLYVQEGAPRKTKQGYDLRAWIPWVVERRALALSRTRGNGKSHAHTSVGMAPEDTARRAVAPGVGGPGGGEVGDDRPVGPTQDELLKNLRIEKARLELEKSRGEVVSRAAAEEACLMRTRFFARALDSLSAALPPQLVGKRPVDQRKVIEEYVAGLRRDIVAAGSEMMT